MKSFPNVTIFKKGIFDENKNRISCKKLIKDLNINIIIKFVGIQFFQSRFSILLELIQVKNNIELSHQLDRELLKFKKEDKYKKILSQYGFKP